MRIALFSGNYNYIREGANQALNRLVAYLEGQVGHQVRVYSPVTQTPAFEPAGTLVPVPSVALPVRGEFRLALRLPPAIRADVAAFAPDIVHLSTPDILGTRAQTLGRRLGVPIVASLHTRFETYLDHYRLGWARPALEAHLQRFYRRSDLVLAPNAALAEILTQWVAPERIAIWSRGVDRDAFNPALRNLDWRRRHGISDDELVILFFGRLVLEKGVDRFVEVVRILRARGLKIRAMVVGAGPAEARFAALGDALLTGHLDGSKLGEVVASADIMLNPSTTEAFGNVVLEAMAAGLTIVSADAPSTRGLVDHGRTGLLCDPTSADGYVEAIARLVAEPALRTRVGAAAREASAAYSWDAASAAVETAYRTLLPRLQNGLPKRRETGNFEENGPWPPLSPNKARPRDRWVSTTR